MDSLRLIVVTPRRRLLEADAQWVDLPAASGWLRALPGHAPTLGELGAGVLAYQDDKGAEQHLALGGGFLELLADRVTLLADSAEFPADIDAAVARAELERLRNEAPGDEGDLAAEARRRALDLAQARLSLAAGK